MQTLWADNKSRTALYTTAAALIFLIIITSLNAVVLNPDLTLWLYDITLVISAVSCAVLAILLMSNFKRGDVNEGIMMAIAIGFVLWAVAEMIYASYELFGFGDVPFPSVADLAWVIGYLPFFYALIVRFRTLRTELSAAQWITALVIVGGLAGVSWIYLLSPIIAETPDPIELFLSLAYPVGDLLLVLGSVLVVMVLFGGEMSVPWLIMAAAFFTLAVADSLFYYADWTGLYVKDAPSLITAVTDTLYCGSYAIIGMGLYVQGRIQRAF